jgi:hypothetical protein
VRTGKQPTKHIAGGVQAKGLTHLVCGSESFYGRTKKRNKTQKAENVFWL